MSHTRIHCRIHGRVQGVMFRASTAEQAQCLQLSGWVRNRRDGTVELVAEGDPSGLQRLIDWCHQGPPAAQVTHVEVTWEEVAGTLETFTIR